MTFQYANRIGYTDIEPFEIVRRVSDKTLEVRAMKAERDPGYKPNFVVGGFSAVCVNQGDQQWVITSDPERRIVRVRKHADGQWRCAGGDRYALAVKPIKYYDYNF